MADPIPEPISWRAIQWIADLLSPIKTAAGWHTDLGSATVFTDRSQHTEGNAPFVVIVADEVTVLEDSSGTRTLASDMSLTVEYAIPTSDSTNAELLAHRGRADLVRALLSNLRGAPEGFRNLTVTGSRFTSVEDSGSSLIIAQVSARAGLSESKSPA